MLDPTDLDLNEETLLAWKTARETRPPDTHTNELLLLIQRTLYDLHQQVPVKLTSDEIARLETATGITVGGETAASASMTGQDDDAAHVNLSDAIQQLRSH
jgi:hypothetical protein